MATAVHEDEQRLVAPPNYATLFFLIVTFSTSLLKLISAETPSPALEKKAGILD